MENKKHPISSYPHLNRLRAIYSESFWTSLPLSRNNWSRSGRGLPQENVSSLGLLRAARMLSPIPVKPWEYSACQQTLVNPACLLPASWRPPLPLVPCPFFLKFCCLKLFRDHSPSSDLQVCLLTLVFEQGLLNAFVESTKGLRSWQGLGPRHGAQYLGQINYFPWISRNLWLKQWGVITSPSNSNMIYALVLFLLSALMYKLEYLEQEAAILQIHNGPFLYHSYNISDLDICRWTMLFVRGRECKDIRIIFF